MKRLKVKCWKKVFHANNNQKRAGMVSFVRQIRLQVKKSLQDKVTTSYIDKIFKPHEVITFIKIYSC